jgi:protein-L-isoaspartate(D-aspartate) O-methyltransferase
MTTMNIETVYAASGANIGPDTDLHSPAAIGGGDTAPSASAFAAMRQAMVASQLRPNAVSDPRVVLTMARMPREDFLPANVRALAYRDATIPLGGGRYANLPMATGRLLTEAYLTATDRVLLIGAATGYTAAVLADVVASVVAVESDPALLTVARTALADVGNVELVEAPMPDGYAAGAPYDVLVIDGAVEFVPDALIAQLRSGGRVVAGLAEQGLTRLASGRKTDGGFALAAFVDCECVSLPGFETPKPFKF